MTVHDMLAQLLQVGGTGFAGALLMYLVLPLLGKRKQLSIEVLQTIAMVCEKAVMALEQSDGNLSGPDKKQRAIELVAEILSHLRINAPQTLVDAGIEAAVLLMNALTKRGVSA